jgi:hypothetical protein
VSPWIHLLSKHSQTTTTIPAIDMTRGGVFENGQEGIIAIDIQDGYDKFNDNVKNTFDSSQDLNITINEDVFTLIMKVKLRVMDCLKRFCSSTRPYRNRQNWEQFDVIDRLGAFEMYSQQLTYSNGGLMKKAV